MGFKERILEELNKHSLSINDVQEIAKEMGINDPHPVLGELFKSRIISSFLNIDTNPGTVTYYLL